MKKSTVKNVLALLKPYRAQIFCSLFCAVVSVAAALIIPIVTGSAIDAMFGSGRVNFTEVLQKIVTIAAWTAAAVIAQYLLAVFNNQAAYGICADLRNRYNAKLHSLPVSFLDTHSSGDLLSRMVADVDAFSDGLLMGFTQLFTGVTTIVAVLAIMFYLNTAIALAVALLTPLSILSARFIATRISRWFREQAAVRGEETALINELIEGQQVIKTFGAQERTQQAFFKVNRRLQNAALKATFFSSLTNPTTRMINNIVYALVAFIGALYAVSGKITVGGLSIFLSYAGQYAKPFNEISGVVTELQNALTCAERIFAVLREPDRAPDPEHPLDPPVKGAVELKNVCFSYQKQHPLITNLNLTVQPGQRIAIVGPTGCGKTTLINLLMRFYDVNSGSILVDNADIRKMSRQNLRARYGMVLQDTWLSNTTVFENIAYGKPNATEQEVTAAARAAFAHSFIKRLPQGYQTVITGGGSNLSAGQRQLLCIARAMLSLPPMLILDEATSSIDTRTEQKVQSAFAKMMQGRTSFIVAHRLSTIQSADVILVMNNGQVIEQGRHGELLRQNGFYAKLYYSQFSNENNEP